MIDYIEISPSGRAMCQECHNKINKFEIRGGSQFNNRQRVICEKCLKEELGNMDNKILELKKEANKMINMTKEEKEDFLLRKKVIKSLK